MREDPELKSIIDDLASKLVRILRLDQVGQSVTNTINKSYGKGMEKVEVQFDMNFREVPAKKRFLEGYTFENIKDLSEDLANKLRKEIQTSLMNNEGLVSMKRRIKKALNVSEVRASTIARTESNRAEQVGGFDAAKQLPFEVKKWLLVTEDERTSAICGAMHRKYGTPEQAIPLDKNFIASVKQGKKTLYINQLLPPFHPNERTDTQYTQVDEE